jgi:MFS family permease
MGFGVCCLLVGSQTALNHFSHENNRASINGLYFLALGVGFGLGPAIGPHIYATSPQLAFCFGGLILLSALVVVRYSFPTNFVVSVPSRSLFLTTVKKLKISISGGFFYGFVEATLISLYPLFLLRQNYSLEQVGYSFSIFVLGSILFTLPVSYLADRFSKTKILSISLWIGLLATLGLVLFEQYHLTLLFSFLMGAGIGPVYPLCLSLIGEQLPKKELPSGTALFMTIYSIGCAAGPILSSIAIETFGNRHIFSLCIPLYAILLLRIGMQNKR